MANEMILNKNILRYIGLWPNQSSNVYLLSNFIYDVYTLFIFANVFLHVLSEIMALIMVWGNIPNMVNIVCIMFTGFSAFIKMINTIYKIKELQELVIDLENNVYEFKNWPENDWTVFVQKAQQNGALLTKTYVCMWVVGAIVWIFAPFMISSYNVESVSECIINGVVTHLIEKCRIDKPLAFVAWFPFDDTVSPLYEMAYLFQAVTSIITIIVVCSVDTFCITLFIHCTYQYEFLNTSLANILERVRNRHKDIFQGLVNTQYQNTAFKTVEQFEYSSKKESNVQVVQKKCTCLKNIATKDIQCPELNKEEAHDIFTVQELHDSIQESDGLTYQSRRKDFLNPNLKTIKYKTHKNIPTELNQFTTEPFFCLNFENALYDNLVYCVKHHEKIMSFIKKVESVFGTVILMQFLSSTLIICFVGFQLVEASSELNTLLKSVLYMILALIQLFMYCYYGDNLRAESEKMTTAVYSSDWFNTTDRFRKGLVLLMTRCQKTINISAGKYYNVSLETYAKLLNSSYKYFALLQQLNK